MSDSAFKSLIYKYNNQLMKEDENPEFISLYESFKDKELQKVLSTVHSNIYQELESLNTRLPARNSTRHFWAENSRKLIDYIGKAETLCRSSISTSCVFTLANSYKKIFDWCSTFLENSGGSLIPENSERLLLNPIEPMFIAKNTTFISNMKAVQLFPVGHGSYANVTKYKDENYNKEVVVKTAKKDITPKELERFKREFGVMSELNSPYIVDVYAYNEIDNSYTMELMDFTLLDYIKKHNSVLDDQKRRGIGNQILRAFSYLSEKQLLHRDISYKNILVKKYDDGNVVVKVADFGLVKIPDSSLTDSNTEYKGSLNDPALRTEFSTYSFEHEIYALTLILKYIFTGKTSSNGLSEKVLEFYNKGTNINIELRYKNISEITKAFNNLFIDN